QRIERRFGVAVSLRGTILADRLGIRTRHMCRDFETRHERPRPGESNPDLAAAALRVALEEAQLGVGDLTYLIGHTATPARLVPPNIALVADRVGFTGPYLELRQACTGFANALVIAQGLLSVPGTGAVARDLGTGIDVVDHVVPHQANGHLAELLGPYLGIEPRRVFVNADHLGNTGSAAIWPALAELRRTLAPGASVVALGAEATKYMF